MSDNPQEVDQQVVRLSFMWLLIGVIAMLGLGITGGVIGSYFWPASNTPLLPEQSQLITTVQEVTISPNTSAANLVDQANRSIVLLRVPASANNSKVIAAGAILTNDGLVVTAGNIPKKNVFGSDSEGKMLDLERVGTDVMYGLTFFKIRNGVLPPLDIRGDNLPVGYTVKIISRSVPSLTPKINDFLVSEFSLPDENYSFGIQKILASTGDFATDVVGSPLIDDEGRLSGLLTDPIGGFALSSNQVQQSLKRITQGEREKNVLDDFGIDIKYSFRTFPDGNNKFVVVVESVIAGSKAVDIGIKKGDIITHLNDEELNWDRSLVSDLMNSENKSLIIRRGSNLNEIIISLVEVES